ncbi:MAG TPA: helix-turn-helix domain-containing protein [Vicinamibacteria bacterium]
MDAALTFSGGAAAALFQREHDDMLLFASVGVEQSGLEAVNGAWSSQRERLLAGEPVLANGAEVSRAIVPVAEGPELVGLLYVESSRAFQPQQAPVLSQLARIASMAFVIAPAMKPGEPETEPVESYLARTPPEDVGRQQLVALLAHNGWNIAKVARVLEVTRATVYNRLARFGIQRQRALRVVPGLKDV